MNQKNHKPITMPDMFPLKSVLEHDEYATLEDIEELNITFGPQTRNWSNESLTLKSQKSRENKKTKDLNILNQAEVINCLISIFDDAMDEIYILSGGRRSENAIEQFNKTLKQKVESSFLYDPIYDNITGIPYPVHLAKQKLMKVLTDSSKVNEFLVIMRNELKDESAIKSVEKIANNIIHREFEEINLLSDEYKNLKTLKNFKQILANQNKETQKHVDDIQNTLYDTKDKTDGLLFENLLREKYLKDWENARREQNALFCKRAEDDLTNMIDKCNTEISTETRVFTEEERFLLEQQNDLQYDIKFWSDRLVEESEQRILQNQILKEISEDLQKDYEELSVLYESHMREIECYLRMKERRAVEWEIKERRRLAAIKIQAWWRGLMVRCKLGPFNPRKKRRKGKKGKKGGKKKK